MTMVMNDHGHEFEVTTTRALNEILFKKFSKDFFKMDFENEL